MKAHPLKNQLAVLFGLVASLSVLSAQIVISPPAITSAPPPPLLGRQKPVPSSELASAFKHTGPLFEWGPVSVLRPHISYRFLHIDGLNNANEQGSSDSDLQQISGESSFKFGRHWTLHYSVSKSIYSNASFRDTFDHQGSLQGGISYGDWTFGIAQTYQTNSPTLVETGEQTAQKRYSTTGSVSYVLGFRTLLDASVTRSVRLSNNQGNNPDWVSVDWYSWSTSEHIRYQLSHRFEAALGVDMGMDKLGDGSDMTSIQPSVKASWEPTEKFAFAGQIGAESRRFRESGSKRLNNPVYSGSIQYKPLNVTTLSLAATQSVSASYFANQVSKSATLSATLSQRLLQKLYLTAGVSRGKSSYLAPDLALISTRNDRSDSYNASISTTFLNRGSITLMYQEGRNTSDISGFAFTTRQVGIEIGYQY